MKNSYHFIMPILRSPKHAKTIWDSLADSTDFCDITLVAGNDNEKYLNLSSTFLLTSNNFHPIFLRVRCHRLILNEYEYFRNLLSKNFREGFQDEITLQTIDGSTLKNVKKFLYTGCIEMTEENAVDVIHAASGFGLIALRKLCDRFCGENLSVANCVDVLLLAEQYDLEKLTTTAIQFIYAHFESIARNDFLKMNKQLFKKMLGDRHEMESEDEIIVFARLRMWINRNESNEQTEVHSELESKPDGNYSELLELIILKNIEDNVSIYTQV